MTPSTRAELENILTGDPWSVRAKLRVLLDSTKDIEPLKGTRTESQHNALFLWYGMIEKEAENAGITWDRVIQHTHQLRITKENLHSMGKDLQKALWGTDSTKKLKKIEQIDILVDHFVDLFSKVGLELPPFPTDKTEAEVMGGYKSDANKQREDYPEYKGKTAFE